MFFFIKVKWLVEVIKRQLAYSALLTEIIMCFKNYIVSLLFSIGKVAPYYLNKTKNKCI